MNHLPSILIYGSAPDLIETRQWVLEHAGFDVTVSLSLKRTTELLAGRSFDLFVLCHSLSPSDCEDALSQARDLRSPTKNLILCKALSLRHKTHNDAYLDTFASPEALIASARELTAHVHSKI